MKLSDSSEDLANGQNSGVVCLLLRSLSDVIVCVGIGLGFYTRWDYFGYTVILALAVFGLFVVTLNIGLRYYFACRPFEPLVHVWLSASLCTIGLLDSPNLSVHKHLEDLMNVLFVCGLVCRVLVDVFFIFCKNKPRSSASTKHCAAYRDTFQILGFYTSCVVCGSANVIFPLFSLVTALYANLLALKLKSHFAVLNATALCFLTDWYLLPGLNVSINPYAIICALGRLYCTPLLELYLVPSVTRLDRWTPIILSRPVVTRLMVVVFALVEVCFFAVHAGAVSGHKEWYVVVPIFVALSIVWLMTHLLSTVIVGTLSSKFAYCRQSMTGGQQPMTKDAPLLKRVLAARGLRYFSLIARKLVSVTVATTLMVAAVCWTTPTLYSHSLTACVLALEIIVLELLNELTYNLGGTCIGYAVVAPVALLRSDGLVNILPQTFIQEVGLRSTQIVNCVVQFFAQHLITNFGCDWSTSGVDWADMQKKLTAFFAQCTNEGPRYDTYVLYYSGPVTGKGDWALTGDFVASLEKILELWDDQQQKQNVATTGCSRLLLICDCEHSSEWLKSIKYLPTARTTAAKYVALQTFRFARKIDPESVAAIGDFTRSWVDYNFMQNRNAFDRSDMIRPAYSVSRAWTDFHFHFPSSGEIRNYWQNYLPKVTHSFLGAIITLTTAARLPVFACCDCVARTFKRWRMRVWPPNELDTGHGFKLLRL